MFRVIITKNGKYQSTIRRFIGRKKAFAKFNEVKKANKVIFEKRYVLSYKIKPVKYELCVVKITEPNDVFRILRDDFGRQYLEEPLGDWTILHSEPYAVEETFNVYGFNFIHERFTLMDVYNKILKDKQKSTSLRQVIVIGSMLMVYNEVSFDLIFCKCIYDAQRLHHMLYDKIKKEKLKHLIFMGTCAESNYSKMYDVIQANTNWDRKKIGKKILKVWKN
jgi:hypothetical protein